jgi:hypothetical protein
METELVVMLLEKINNRRDIVVAGHRHGAEAYAGDVESADRNVLHAE